MSRTMVFGAALTSFALLVAPAGAVTNWSLYKTFANTKCESPKTIADMVEAAKGFPIFHDLAGLRVVSAKTIRSTSNTLACRVKISVSYRGEPPQFVSGKFTVKIDAGGWHAKFDENY